MHAYTPVGARQHHDTPAALHPHTHTRAAVLVCIKDTLHVYYSIHSDFQTGYAARIPAVRLAEGATHVLCPSGGSPSPLHTQPPLTLCCYQSDTHTPISCICRHTHIHTPEMPLHQLTVEVGESAGPSVSSAADCPVLGLFSCMSSYWRPVLGASLCCVVTIDCSRS